MSRYDPAIHKDGRCRRASYPGKGGGGLLSGTGRELRTGTLWVHIWTGRCGRLAGWLAGIGVSQQKGRGVWLDGSRDWKGCPGVQLTQLAVSPCTKGQACRGH